MILPAQLRTAEARWVLPLVLVVLLATLIVGDPGRIDRNSTWLRVTTSTLIGVISLANAAAVIRLVAAITIGQAKFTNDANVLLASGVGLRSTPGTPPASYPIAVHPRRLTLSGSGVSPHQRQPHSAGSPSS